MPNHVEQDMTIWGRPSIVEYIITHHINETGALDADSVIPYPDEFKRQDAVLAEWMKKNTNNGTLKPGFSYDDMPKNGYNSGGYEWCIANWGTKWGCYDGSPVKTNLQRNGKAKAFLSFHSAWSPAIPVFAKLAQLYPLCRIKVEYFECGMGYKGIVTYDRGRIVKDVTSNYRGNRGG